MPGNQKGGDHMARKKTLEELQAEREKAEQDLKRRQENEAFQPTNDIEENPAS